MNVCVLEPISFAPKELDLLTTTTGTVYKTAFWNQFRHADVLGSLILPNQAITCRTCRLDWRRRIRADGDLSRFGCHLEQSA